ncbi:hypothetical protein JY651_46210 [Pyxidicoccus parkwayensis]|uniref:Lipoprotein n=1 Tax=Pyxidicoccus parkwayensis TaxID=2813578 RepID=A0ABX7NU48_9BACT|nr:DUF6174 domain-containing protein [Pyxidicoccus parkwaysis]QSQ22436.1 hypothetical protein JY651_46210 [Pyxidicoccus parkwaysis]
MVRSGWSRGIVIRALTGALIFGTLACGDRAELDSQRRAWESVRPSHYHFDYTVRGFAPGGGPWRLEVKGTQVVSATYVGSGPEPTPGVTAAFAPTIDDLFDQVAQGLDASSVEVSVSYDPQWHHPADAYFDAGEEGDGFRAGSLEPVE